MKTSVSPRPRLGLYTNACDWSYEDLREVWLAAERRGFDSAHLMDNAVGPNARGPQLPVLEAYTALAALAEATESIVLGPLATPVGRRHPSLLAKMTSILDQVSEGRLILALGTGDDPLHFEPWGMDFPPQGERTEMLEEALGVIGALWTRERTDFEGRHYRLAGAVNQPKPAQSPRPPLWLGFGQGTRVMPRLVAEYCDGYNLWVGSDERAAEVIDAVSRACERVGRDEEELTASRHVLLTLAAEEFDLEEMYARQSPAMGCSAEQLSAEYEHYYCHVAGPPEVCAEGLERLFAMGFDHLALQMQAPVDPMGGSAGSTLELIDLFMDRVAPELTCRV